LVGAKHATFRRVSTFLLSAATAAIQQGTDRWSVLVPWEIIVMQNRKRLRLLTAGLLFVAMQGGCNDDAAADAEGEDGHAHSDGHDHEHEAEMVGPPTEATCPEESDLTYDSFAKKFLADYCLRCHSTSVTGAARMKAPDDHNFDTYADVDLLSAHIDQLAGSGPAGTNTVMPPSAPFPSEEDRKKLSEWIACNRPE
jgi:uncharacterized membrane protein